MNSSSNNGSNPNRGREPSKTRQGPMELGDACQKAVRDSFVGDRIEESRLFALWNDTVGETLARQFQPVAFHEGVLTVHFENHAWAQEMNMRREALVETLNQRLDRPRLTDLRFRFGPLKVPARPAPSSPPATADRTPSPPAKTEEIPHEALAPINDPDLREGLGRLAESIRGRKPQ